MNRRTVLLLGLPLPMGAAHLAAHSPVEIRITSRKFEFHPAKVTVKLGQPVVLVLTTGDRIHGLKMPDFGIRVDVVPGQETRLPLTPDRAGSFAFLCDVFCGDGHDAMDGTLIVEA